MNLLSLEDEKIKDVEVMGHKFKIRFISPTDKIVIARERTKLQNGQPVEAFTVDDFTLFQSVATVNICTEEFPKPFKSNESCLNWQDEELIIALANEIFTHTEDIKSKLKKNRPTLGGE